MVNLGVLVSGGGTNLQAIIDAIEAGRLDASIKLVFSNNPNAYALDRARRHGLPSKVLLKDDFTSREAYDSEAINALKDAGVELVILAGFMRLITKPFLDAFPTRIMNIHPSLLPSFPGLDVQKKALDWGVKFSGCTVHFVDEGLDSGPIIIQAVVPVLEDDTPEILSQRILKEEHRIYPQAIQLFSDGRLEVRGRRVFIRDGHADAGPLENPRVTIF